MKEEKKIIVLDKAEKARHVQISFGLLYTTLLTAEEKLCFIALRSFVEFGKDAGEVFPTLETVCQITNMSRPRVTRSINGLIKKGLVTKKRQGLSKPNLYYLADNPYIWKADTEEEMKKRAEQAIPYSSKEMIEDLLKRGDVELLEAAIEKAKKEGLSSASDQRTEESPNQSQRLQRKDTKKGKNNQEQDVVPNKRKKNAFNDFQQRQEDEDLDAIMMKRTQAKYGKREGD